MAPKASKPKGKVSKPDGDTSKSGGGRHQRASAARVAGNAASSKDVMEGVAMEVDGFSFDIEFAFEVVQQWAWGHTSASMIQKECRTVVNGMRMLLTNVGQSIDNIPESLLALASLGTEGRHPGHCHRDLQRKIGEPVYPEPGFLRAPMHISKPKDDMDAIQDVPFPIMHIHEVFSFLYEHHPSRFYDVFVRATNILPR